MLKGRKGRVSVGHVPVRGHFSQADEAESNDMRRVLIGLQRLYEGDFSVRLRLRKAGLPREIAAIFNSLARRNQRLTREFVRIADLVGRQGRVTERASLDGMQGSWGTMVEAQNSAIDDLVRTIAEISRVIRAVASGDLSQTVPDDAAGRPVKGDLVRVGRTVNTMVDQLRAFAAEVTRVAKEVGIEGKLGGQARVPGVSGTWKDLTDNVNGLAGKLTAQVRAIALVTTAVANGDLSQKITVDARGEIFELKDTINTMVDQLRSFAAEVTRVAKEVGIEGKLGGQARVPGVSGTWKDLTDNVNGLAGNLTAQVRAIAEVSTAVTKGDLTRSITVEAEGEVLALKDNINQMIQNLKDTTEKNTEQDWLKTNLARFSVMMQGQKNLSAVSRLIMSELTPLISAQHGAFYAVNADETRLNLVASYAYTKSTLMPTGFEFGEGIVGQCAQEQKPVTLDAVPDDYIRITSGLGYAAPAHILVLPVLFEGNVLAVIELASFHPFNSIHRIFLDQLMVSVGVVLNIIGASMRTDELLQELQNSNGELEMQAKELEEKATLLEIKNQEIEMASLFLEEKAEQLALISNYKSEFLANMSHELRTPLNSLLIMAKLLAENRDTNLSAKQIQFANTIHSSGRDLLNLINEILDLSKVEAGKMEVVASDISLPGLVDSVVRDFQALALQKDIGFSVKLADDMPEFMYTDGQRLQQVLKNLLSNAFKFTDTGTITLEADRYEGSRASFQGDALRESEVVIAFTVRDTGIGVVDSKQKLIFEAFQQADATTSRKYGGTGLGLTISREISRLLGGEIQLHSIVGEGSCFTVYMPQTYLGTESEHGPTEARVLGCGDVLTDGMEGEIEHNITFFGEKVLVVDDDARNIFAISSLLENHKLNVVFAENGANAIEILKEDDSIDIVLMDAMMPSMDGYETTQAIRKLERYQELPIIALAAKAMKGDREKSLEAGSSDYIAKPVETGALLRIIKKWLVSSAGSIVS
ncbi:MAG: response regulator [Acidiferrobacter sp.]